MGLRRNPIKFGSLSRQLKTAGHKRPRMRVMPDSVGSLAHDDNGTMRSYEASYFVEAKTSPTITLETDKGQIRGMIEALAQSDAVKAGHVGDLALVTPSDTTVSEGVMKLATNNNVLVLQHQTQLVQGPDGRYQIRVLQPEVLNREVLYQRGMEGINPNIHHDSKFFKLDTQVQPEAPSSNGSTSAPISQR